MTYLTQLSSSIAGEWIGAKARDSETVIEPATGKAIADLPHVTTADLDRALDAADRGGREWRATPVAERAALLTKAAALLTERADEIAVMLSREQGKPLAQAKAEVAAGINILRLHPEEAKRAYGRTLVRGPGKRASITYEPVGPAAGFATWNFPFFNVARKVAPALAAGCSIISKPAEETPASAIMLQRALLDAGVPGSASQLVFGDPDMISRHLIASPVIRKISFTGSVPVGRHLAKLAGETLKRTTMELGGHAPVIVFDDADLDKYLDLFVTTKFRNAGQVCVSPTRYYVQEGIYERFAAEFAKRTEEMVTLGDPLDAGTVMGPLANARRPAAVGGIIDDAVACGARVLTGAEPVYGAGYFYRPTVLVDVPESARIMQEEPFGPVASMRPFKTLDEAVAMANRLPYGLAAYVFTENLNRALLASDGIEAGMVAVNSMTLAPGDAPFGGIKDSGHGMEDGPEGLQAYMVPKVIHIG